MLKFLPGLILLQIATIGLFLIAPPEASGLGWLRIIIPLGIIAVLMALWFSSLSVQLQQDKINALKEQHFREREKLKVGAEREKLKANKAAQRHIEKEILRTSAKANFKVGAAVVGVVGIGGLLLLTQFMALGIMTLTTAGGVMGGYMLRYRQEKSKALTAPETTMNLPPVHLNEAPVSTKK